MPASFVAVTYGSRLADARSLPLQRIIDSGVTKIGCAPRSFAACAIIPYDILNASTPT